MKERDDETTAGSSGIQLDVYGIKAVISPSSREDDQDPSSWREVASAINADLRSISLGIFRLLKETLKSATMLVRGIGKLPGATADRIRGAHAEVDQIESSRQAQARGGASLLVDPGDKEAVLRRLKALLDKKRVEGLTVRTYSDGQRIVIWISKPIEDDEIEQVVHASLSSASEKALPAPTTETK